jgi:hypothetical protein
MRAPSIPSTTIIGSSRIFITIFRIARALTRQLTDMLGHSIFNVQKLPINLTILNILKDIPRFYITRNLP